LYFFSLITYFHPFLEKAGFAKWMMVQSAEIFLHVFTQMIFCYVLLYYLLPKYLNNRKYAAFTVRLLLLSAVTMFIYYREHIFLFKYIHLYAGMPFMPPNITLWYTVISFLSYFPRSAALVLAIKTLKNWYIKLQENQQLILENANAELQLLKAQVHPHFLFNTLNNIYSFTLNKSPGSPLLIKKLSSTLHYMINECEDKWVPLEKELMMISDYMELEKVRYGNRIAMEVNVTGDAGNKAVTPLLLIPFIENSFKHGASQMLQHPWIKMQIRVGEKSLFFQLSNSRPATTIQTNGKSGIGLSNVKKRLELIYPARHKLDITSSPGIFSVEMQIPVNEIKTNTTPPEDKITYPSFK
jgi:sensor histidine kinase YesM